MSRVFPGGGGTDNLAVTITAYDSGAFSVFAWTTNAGGGGGSNPRIFHIGTGTSGQIFYSSGGGSRSLEQQYSTTQMLSSAPFSFGSGWEFTVITYDGAALNPGDPTDIDLFNGDVSTAMVDTNTMSTSGGSIGVGSRVTGLVDLVIGNRQNGLNRCWSGNLFCVGMVPYRLTLTEAEQLRQGNMYVLNSHSAPIFLFGLEGTDLTSHSGFGPSLTLTATGTTTTTDPITLTWSSGTTYNQSVSGGITPIGNLIAEHHWTTGAIIKQTNKPLAAGNTPAGLLAKSDAKASAGTLTSGAVLNNQTNKNLAGGMAPAGTLTADFISGAPLIGISPVIEVARQRAITHVRPYRWAAYNGQRNYYDSPKSIVQSTDGTITPTGTMTRAALYTRFLHGDFT